MVCRLFGLHELIVTDTVVAAEATSRHSVLREQILQIIIKLRRRPRTRPQSRPPKRRSGGVLFLKPSLRHEGGVVEMVLCKADLAAEACCALAHLDGGFGHAIEGVATSFCGGAFGGKV